MIKPLSDKTINAWAERLKDEITAPNIFDSYEKTEYTLPTFMDKVKRKLRRYMSIRVVFKDDFSEWERW